MSEKKIVVRRTDVLEIQKKGYLKGIEEVNNIWDKLCESCPDLKEDNNNNIKDERIVLDLTKEVKGDRAGVVQHVDICITYSPVNGTEIANLILQKIQKRGLTACLSNIEKDFNANSIEINVANSTSLIVLLTKDALKCKEVVFSMTVAQRYYRQASQVILVHVAESCFFPSLDEQPPSVSDYFSEKAITFLTCYADKGIDQIVDKYASEKIALDNAMKNDRDPSFIFKQFLENTGNKIMKIEDFKTYLQKVNPSLSNEKVVQLAKQVDKDGDGQVDAEEFAALWKENKLIAPPSHHEEQQEEDLTTRVFLSHKRSTAQGIAGRLFEGLKDKYKVFLDSEAKFKIHKLSLIVENTSAFVFILSHGILLSKWCLEELKSAVAYNKQVIIVRDLSYSLPDILPPEWKEMEHIIRMPDQLIWMAEYNAACIEELRKRIGPYDEAISVALRLLHSYPSIIQNIQETCTLDLTRETVKKEDEKSLAARDLLLGIFSQLHQMNISFQLKTLKLAECGLSGENIYLLPTQPIQQLNVDRSQSLTDTGFKCLIEKYHDIQHLDLRNCVNVTDSGFQYIGKCHNIQYLSLQSCYKLTDAGLKFIVEGCPNIQQLDLESCGITDVGLKLIGEKWHNVQQFNVSKCRITDAGLGFIGEGCHDIQQLNLSICTNTTDAGLQFIGEGCHNIRQLNLTYCQAFTDAGFKFIGEGCHNLQQLRLEGCYIADGGLKFIAEGCHNIQDLNLSGCIKLTDAGLKFIGEGCPNIQQLSLLVCQEITDTGLKFIGEGCHNIQELSLEACPKITDAGLKFIGEGCHNIRKLNLSRCKITDAGLKFIGEGCHDIQELRLISCNNITDAGLGFILDGCPGIKIKQ